MTPIGPDPVRTFEIGLDGDVADLVRRVAPEASEVTVPTLTVLWSRIGSVDELDALLGQLLSLGITPEVLYETMGDRHRGRSGVGRPGPVSATPESEAPAGSRYCEVRVPGVLGRAVLHHLQWSSQAVRITVVRIQASYETLRSILARLGSTADIDYVIAV